MAPIKKTISFSGTKELRTALKAEANNLHQNIISLVLLDKKDDSGNTFNLVFDFNMDPWTVKQWSCKGEYNNGTVGKNTLRLGEEVEPTSLEVLYYTIITDVEKLYNQWLKLIN